MVKKKVNTQNIIIIILCILLAISIAFGVTYSYYNGKTNLVKGTITTANLSIKFEGSTQDAESTEFSITAPFGEEFLVPGSLLDNIQLNLLNKCNQETYMVVVFSLSAVKNDGSEENITNKLQGTPAIDFKENTVGEDGKPIIYVDKDIWRPITYVCENKTFEYENEDKTIETKPVAYTCLVGLNKFAARGESDFTQILVLGMDALRIPTRWGDDLQNCRVTISIQAYAIQADNLGSYETPIIDAEDKYAASTNNAEKDAALEEKSQAIANAVLEICKVDKA